MENKDCKIGLYDDCFNEVIFLSVKEKSTCLDVGCWTGNLGKALTEKKECEVDGIDCNQESLEKAKDRGYRKTYSIDLNDEKIDFNIENEYDFIICADVLEHLIDPGAVLKKIQKLLEAEGQILISVPNIAFVQQRLELLMGKFDYSPQGGIMDENHLRFFTMQSIQKLCRESGYHVIECRGYSQVKRKFFFLRPLAKIWPSLFAIQFFLKIKRK
jgi:methionine biosynthesis protein MetW